MKQPRIFVGRRDKESRAIMITDVANEVMDRLIGTGNTAHSIIAKSIIVTILEGSKLKIDYNCMIESVEDLLSAYELVRLRSFGLESRN